MSGGQIRLQQLRLDQLLLLLLVEKMNAGGVDIQAALNASPAGGRHPAPVDKGVGDQRPRRDGGDGVIEVAHLHGGQADVRHRTVSAVFWHLQPVAELEHIVGGKLNPRHQPEYRVFKDQHQHGGHGAQTAYENRRGLADQQGDNQNPYQNGAHQLDALEDPLQRQLRRGGHFLRQIENHVQQREEGEQGIHHHPQLRAGGEHFRGFTAFLQPQNRLNVDDYPLQGKGQTVK